ncbi:TetR/AcrR family transcriptional regulator [Catenisphaera adipataccumulans]|jgi:AcrR family transcriptional regulator|uniref:AcrR family transcriptional regulator n=1 Tax=Catenisphaera adipataccumulans TaxID=700500 RepID=A0A7W8FVZ3_9FIRM|nr:TetR family transcriptional regulator [Catenisphaera adipataccumulans]MBB5182726.1 AcrR family transcriptional regulator [Catenisphaera adipataccumulans]
MDRRQRKTRKAIFDAFSRLLEKKHYSHISVQNIIDEADVGRTTFYAHFQTKEDLLNQMCEDIFGHVFSQVREKEHTHDFSSKPETLKNELTHLLYHLKERQKDIFRLLSGESGDIFLKYFKEQLAKAFDGMNEWFPGSVPKAYAEAVYVTAFAEMVSMWVKQGTIETPETLVNYYYDLMRLGS